MSHVRARSGASVVLPATPGPTTKAVEAANRGTPTADRQIKAGLAVGRMCLIQNGNSRHAPKWWLALPARNQGGSTLSAPATSVRGRIGGHDNPRR
jgi:hypothetical protein